MRQKSVTVGATTATIMGIMGRGHTVDVPVGTAIEFIEGAGGGWALTTDAALSLGMSKSDLAHRYPYINNASRCTVLDFRVTLKGKGYKENKWGFDLWQVVIQGQVFEYRTGVGLRDKKTGRPVPPKYDDVMYCLVNDAEAMTQSFEDWCNNFGYDSDSIKAKGVYDACVANGHKLISAGIDIDAERERLADY